SESDLIRRSLSKMNYLKSWQVESETKTSQEQSNRSLPFDSTSTTLTQFTSDPYVFKSEEISSDGTINASYVKDNVLYRYTKSETSEEWTKGAIPEDRLKDNSYKRSHISNFYRALYIILEVNKDYTFKDNGSTYEFNFKPANADEYRERIFGNNQKVTDFKVEAYSAKYIIDKTTLLPVSVELEQTISYTANSGVKVKLTTSSID
ncbi:hypothetical protein IR145_01685, partial [Streptococcus danieliae]|nr:hypothetical protein [Streptococcus danieliae]